MHDSRRPTPERLGAFSDGVFAVIITIMVLELKPPPQPSFAALLSLWPTGLSYAVSYLFIAIVWVNHHHLLRFAEHATPQLIWWNFAHRDICAGEFSIPRVCLGGVGASGSPREDLGTDAADDSSSIVRDAGVFSHCGGSVAQVSIVGLWTRVLRLICLFAARSLWQFDSSEVTRRTAKGFVSARA
jgi:hypothetical protein